MNLLVPQGVIVSQFNNNCLCSLSMKTLVRRISKAISSPVLLNLTKTGVRMTTELLRMSRKFAYDQIRQFLESSCPLFFLILNSFADERLG